MGTQTKIAAQIIEQEGDYALALKDNQGNLYDEVKAICALAEKDGFVGGQEESIRLVEKGHGRLEIREYWTIGQQEILTYLDPEQKWKGFAGIGMVRSERRIKDLKGAGKPAIFCSAFLPSKRLQMPFEATGALKIASIGFWMWRFACR